MDLISILGYIAGIVSTSTLLPQIYKIWKTKSTNDLALGMVVLGCFGSFLWLVYGILLKSGPIISTNTLILISFTTILFFKLKYK